MTGGRCVTGRVHDELQQRTAAASGARHHQPTSACPPFNCNALVPLPTRQDQGLAGLFGSALVAAVLAVGLIAIGSGITKLSSADITVRHGRAQSRALTTRSRGSRWSAEGDSV